MIRAEPRLAWTMLGAPEAAAPGLLLSRERGWAWGGAVALSALLHAGLAIVVGDAVLDARDRSAPPIVEVELVVPAEPEAPIASAEPAVAPSPAVASPPDPPPGAAEPIPEPVPEPPPVAPKIATSAPPPPKPAAAPAHAAKPDEPPPEPQAHPEPPPVQTALRPPPVEAGKGIEGTANPRRTDMGAGATVRAVVSPPPAYPPIAIQLGEEGTVVVSIEIDRAGAPKAVTVLRSSGFGSLDQAAVLAVRQWRFSVPQNAGRPIATTIEVPVVFKLKHTSR